MLTLVPKPAFSLLRSGSGSSFATKVKIGSTVIGRATSETATTIQSRVPSWASSIRAARGSPTSSQAARPE